MARTRQRFSKLIDELRNTKGNIAPGSRSANFQAFMNGTNRITQTNKPPIGAKKRYNSSVIPFSLAAPATAGAATAYLVTISGYSLSGRASRFSDITEAELGWIDVADATNRNSNFYPAVLKMTFTRGGAATDPAKKSAVTQENYRYTARRNFSVPFGRVATALAGDEYTRKTDLLEQAVGAGAINVSFIPEEFQVKGGGQGTDAFTTPIAVG